MKVIAKVYAKALFAAIKERNGSGDLFEKEKAKLSAVAQALRESVNLRVALWTPSTSLKEKEGLLQALCEKVEASKLIVQYLFLLARKGRLSLLPDIVDLLSEVKLDAEGGILGTLESAEPIEKKDVDSVAGAFSKRLKRPIEFRVKQDPDLLAGIRVTVNGVTYDGTLRSQLSHLKEKIVYGDSVRVH